LELRTTAQRIADTRARLDEDDDVWVATASHEGEPHLVPLSLVWSAGEVVLATEGRSVTARNALATGRVRLALGVGKDAVLIDASARVVALDCASAELHEVYRHRAGWDPAAERGDYVYIVATPIRVQAWRHVGEISGRTVMRDGSWLED
jgi:hypothetical protein